MKEVFDQVEQLQRSERRVALATLVNTRGTTPRREGAKMWVGERGQILGSVTIGGCVDARVIEEAEAVLAENTPRLLEVNLGAEEAWEIGLSCGGSVEVFVEPILLAEPGAPALACYQRLRAHAERGGRGALVTALGTAGPRPADAGAAGAGAGAASGEPAHAGKPGAEGPGRGRAAPERAGPGVAAGRKLLVFEDGTREGSLGDRAIDAAATAAALDLLRRGASRTVVLEGVGRIFVESYGPPSVLVVVGATHVAVPLTALARVLGFRTVIIDARPRFAARERFPDADDLRIGIPSELVRAVPLTPATALVLLAHDYKYDLPVLRHALGTEVGYIGMLGSRRRGEAIRNLLREEGLSEEALARLRVPIGLDLGGESAPEIALAILAEIQAARVGGTGLPLHAAGRRR